MTRQVFPGGWYADALPSGAFVVLIPHSHLLTHLGLLTLPPGESFGLGFVRCTEVGSFRFAGQAHDTIDPACWEWIHGLGWKSYPQPCVGVSPVLYDSHGVLHRSDGSLGSQGFRYVNAANQIVSGDATYGPFHGLFEYTQLAPDLWIGQGATDGSGVRVWDGTTLRQLERGDGRFIRATVAGDRVAVAWMASIGAVVVQTTLSELRALPPVAVVVTPPDDPIHPPKEPQMEGLSDAQFATLERERAKYGVTVSPVEIGAILNATAWAHRDELGLQAKPGGTSAVQPRTFLKIWNGLWIRRNGGDFGQDVLSGASIGIAKPVRGEIYIAQPKLFAFVAPVEPVGVVQPPSDTGDTHPPPVPTFDATDILRRLRDAEQRLLALEGPRRVALKTNTGHYICEDLEHTSTPDGSPALLANRLAAGAWETFTVEPQ